jgi:hypothetical protein
MSPTGIEGYASCAEDAEIKALALAEKLGLEIHDEIIHVEV